MIYRIVKEKKQYHLERDMWFGWETIATGFEDEMERELQRLTQGRGKVVVKEVEM